MSFALALAVQKQLRMTMAQWNAAQDVPCAIALVFAARCWGCGLHVPLVYLGSVN